MNFKTKILVYFLKVLIISQKCHWNDYVKDKRKNFKGNIHMYPMIVMVRELQVKVISWEENRRIGQHAHMHAKLHRPCLTLLWLLCP